MRIFTKLSTAALLTVLTAINANAYDLWYKILRRDPDT